MFAPVQTQATIAVGIFSPESGFVLMTIRVMSLHLALNSIQYRLEVIQPDGTTQGSKQQKS
jgi:hypothetical protein